MESSETGEPTPPRTASSAQALLASPEFSVPLAMESGSQYRVAMASAGDITLVVWNETGPNGFGDIRGVRVRKSDGALLDTTSLCIACDSGHEDNVSVASNGSDFLVVWTDQPLENGFPYSPRIKGARVRGADGAVLDSPLSLSPDSPAHYSPAVASDGSNYLVVFRGYQRRCYYYYSRWGSGWTCDDFRDGFYGTRVSATDGSNSANFLLSPTSYPSSGEYEAAVTYGGGNYLVTWGGAQSPNSTSSDTYAARVRASDGVLVDSTPRILAVGGKKPRAASDGSGYLVVWSAPGGEIRAGRLGQDGTVLDPGGFRVSAGDVANVTFDGADYRVAWVQGARTLVRPLAVARVTPAGLVASGSETVLLETTYPSTWAASVLPALAPLGSGRFLLGYGQYIAPPSYDSLVKLRVVEDLPQGAACTQDAQCQSGYCVDGVCCESACGGGAGNDCQACSVAAGGSADGTCGAVRAEAAVVCRPSAVACDVAEVCDGTSLSCPADEPSASEPDLSGDKCEDSPCDVAAWLAALGPESLEQPFGRGLQAKAEAACASFQAGNAQATQGQLRALRNEVRAQHGKKLSASVADTLLAALTGMLGF